MIIIEKEILVVKVLTMRVFVMDYANVFLDHTLLKLVHPYNVSQVM